MNPLKLFEKTTNSLDQELIFYIPSKRKDNTELGILLRAQATHAVMNFLIAKLGGATMIEVRGYFQGDKNKIHSENTTLCISYFAESQLNDWLKKDIAHIANSLAIEFEQETLAVSLNSMMIFFSPTAKYRYRYENEFKPLWENKKMAPIGFRKWVDY